MYPAFILLLSLIELSAAFTLSLPNKFNSGTVVTVQWSRDNGDPVSFGLMQRSLQGNQPILSVTPVENAGGASSGTASVAFNTVGQVLLSAIAELSLSSGERPNQLSAGKQLTVVASNVAVANPPGTPTTVLKTTITTAAAAASSPTATVIVPPRPPQLTSSPSTTPVANIPTISGVFSASSSAASQGRGFSSSSSVTAEAGTGPPSSPSSIPPSTSIPTTGPSSSAVSPVSVESPGKPGVYRGTVIALAVLLPLLFLTLVLFCIIRIQRTSTRHRIDRFTDVWVRRSPARATISSFGGDVESGWTATDHLPVCVPVSESASTGTGIPSPITRRQQKLQLMVEQLTQRNAALEREVDTLASSSALVQPPFSEPPPVYVESPDSSQPPRTKLR